MKSLLLVFAKTPVLGTAKTRLAQSIGNEKALWVYNQLLDKNAFVLKETTQDTVVFYSGDSPESFEPNFTSFPKKPQKGGDLGKRMEAAFQWGFDAGFEKIMIIGTDLWEWTPSLLATAFSALDTHEYVIGPAADGGYYILGMKTLTPQLFRNKNWSSETVLNETLKDLERKSVQLLETKNDIDTIEDLKKTPELYNAYRKKFND